MHGNLNIIVLAHNVQKKRHATAAIRGFPERAVYLSGGNDRFRVSRAHPVDCGVYVPVRDAHAVAHYHVEFSLVRRGRSGPG